jgi:hypothetical protein
MFLRGLRAPLIQNSRARFEVDNDGRARPKIRCDSCGGVIENYGDGVALL